jgi:hypothetical protein
MFATLPVRNLSAPDDTPAGCVSSSLPGACPYGQTRSANLNHQEHPT